MYDLPFGIVDWNMKRIVAAALLLLPALALAQDARRRVSAPYQQVLKQIETMRKTKKPSVSIGESNQSKLVNPAEMPIKNAHGYKIANPDRKTHFGTDEMVFGLMMLGAEMAERYGDDGTFLVYDISRAEGGKLSPHISHQGGRDVDLGFYICDDKNRPQGNRIIDIDKDGKAKSGNLRFDLQRNWDFVCLMADQPAFEGVQFIIVAEWIKDLLLAHGKERAAKTRHPLEREYHLKKVKELERLFYIKNDHDNHYHLRIKVTPEDRKEGGRD
jgi:penicillin-insensitive murein DD-endopeptidase